MCSVKLNSFRSVVSAGVLSLLLASPALAVSPIAQVPEPGSYISIFRVLIILLAIIPWLLFCQWVNQDTLFVRKLNQQLWNGICLGGGLVGLIVWLFLPWDSVGLFAAGFGLWFVITFGACGTYVFIRNSLVDRNSRVFTPQHIRKWMGSLGQKKEAKGLAIERVRVTAHDGSKVQPPSDPSETDAYEAAQDLLFDALWRRATDVEMLLGNNGARLAYRIDGVVTPRNDLLEREQAEMALRYIKQVAGLDVEERRRPQKGDVTVAISGGSGGGTEIEVEASGTTQHERLSMKIVGDFQKLRIGDVGLTAEQRKMFDDFVKAPGGLVLISGPRGSGVTSTCYAAMRSHDAFIQNLLSIEVNPMMELENITQHIYDAGQHEASYARQLQTVLRREPDVVLVSDLMDRETAHLAVSAARNKRIYMGVTAKDSFDALKKLISLAGDTDMVANTLMGVMSQRLIRKLCIACRIAYKPDTQLLKKANLPVDKIEHFYRVPRPEEQVDEKGNPKVCANCQGSGYFGRTAIFEVLPITDEIRNQIRAGQPISTIKATARKAGMHYLQEIGMERVIDGTTSINEMLRVLRDEEGKPGR